MKAPHPDGLAAAKACRTPGHCIFCEEPLTGDRRWICPSPDCRSAYQKSYGRDRRRGVSVAGLKAASEREAGDILLRWCAGATA